MTVTPRRVAALLLAATLAAFSLVLLSTPASADHAASVFITDVNGMDGDPNSVAEQSDLTGVLVGPHGEFGFAWDETDLNGANSSDTCTYYLEPDDSVTAVCYSVQYADGVVTDPLYEIYDCENTYQPGNLKCTGTRPVSDEYDVECSAPEVADPPYFEDDDDADLFASCQLIGLNGNDVDALLLINTCSKPSASPSSDSKDCIFTGSVVFLAMTKVVADGSALPTDWTLAAVGPNAVSGDGQVDPVPLSPGTYALTETGTAPITADYELTSIVCSTDGGEPVDVTEAAELELAGNFTVTTCIFTNSLKPGEIVIEKETVPADDVTTEFTFSTDYLVDDQIIVNGGSFGSGPIPAGDYSVSEQPVPGWEQTSATCASDVDPEDASTLDAIDLDPGETITCTVVNTQLAGAEVAKSGTIVGNEVWNWTLDKSIDLDGSAADLDTDDDVVALSIPQGESVGGLYTVAVNGTSAPEGAAVDWEILVTNPRATPMVVAITDAAVGELTCSVGDETITPDDDARYQIPAGATMRCTGQTAVDVVSNTVTVDVYDLGVITSSTDTTAVAAGELTPVDRCVELDDSLYPALAATICGDEVGQWPYQVTQPVSFDEEDCGGHTTANTASLTPLGGDVAIAADTVTVEATISCDPMTVAKSGTITGDEVWTWTVDKNIDLENSEEDDIANLEIPQGATLFGDYEIVVTGSSEIQDAGVDWTILVTNPRSTDEIVTVDDPLLTALACTNGEGDVTPVEGAYPIGAGESLTCAGSSSYGEQENTVTVTVVGEDVGTEVTAVAAGALDVIDGCVALTDTLYPSANDAEICGDELDEFGNHTTAVSDVPFGSDVCGDHTVANVASIVGDDGTDFGSDTVTVGYEVICADLVVEKSGTLDAQTTWTWTVDKNIDLDEDGDDAVELALDQGDDATGSYEIVVTGASETTGSTRWLVEVTNPRLTPVTVRVIDPTVELACTIGGEDLEAGEGGVYTIGAGAVLECSGSTAVDVTSNTVTVDLLDGETTVDSIERNAAAVGSIDLVDECVAFADSVYVDLDADICAEHLDADGRWTTGVDGVVFGGLDCGASQLVNTASLVTADTAQTITDSVTVDTVVTCDDITATKTGVVGGELVWTWELDKGVDVDGQPADSNPDDDVVDLTAANGTSTPVAYAVELSASSAVVDGSTTWTVEVVNPRLTPVAVRVTDADVALTCSVDLVDDVYTIPAGSTLVCAGSSAHDATTNTATVEVVEGGAVVDTIELAATADGELTVVDRCVQLADSLYPTLDQTVCVDQLTDGAISLPVSGEITADGVCGSVVVTENTATATGADSAAVVADTVTINTTVECTSLGCTRTRGYWQTHSAYGPAAHPDDTWDLLADGPDTVFFSSGSTYYEVLHTAPRGDKWLILAQQYIAAELNLLSGADDRVIAEEMLAAEQLLADGEPGGLSKQQARMATALAGTLDAYNNGELGSPHCD